ncbi:MAG: mechanosensitive ion channel [Flavobacteriales bacterium]
MDIQVDRWLAVAGSAIMNYAPKVVMALLVLWAGLVLIRLLMRGVNRTMNARAVDHTLQKFLVSLVGWGLKILLFISVIQMLGVATTSFVAIIGAAGLAVGLALQGTLANFAGGVLVLLFRPYKVGDLIEAQGITGHVKECQIFTTVLLTPENKTAIIPNGAMANGNIVNYSAEGRIRVDLTFGVAGDTSISEVRRILTEVMRAEPKVMAEPAPSVTVSKLNPEGIELAVRPYCDPADYWDVYFGVYERGQDALRKAGVKGPQPSITVNNRN